MGTNRVEGFRFQGVEGFRVEGSGALKPKRKPGVCFLLLVGNGGTEKNMEACGDRFLHAFRATLQL